MKPRNVLLDAWFRSRAIRLKHSYNFRNCESTMKSRSYVCKYRNRQRGSIINILCITSIYMLVYSIRNQWRLRELITSIYLSVLTIVAGPNALDELSRPSLVSVWINGHIFPRGFTDTACETLTAFAFPSSQLLRYVYTTPWACLEKQKKRIDMLNWKWSTISKNLRLWTKNG